MNHAQIVQLIFYGVLTLWAAISTVQQDRSAKVCAIIIATSWVGYNLLGLVMGTDAMWRLGEAQDLLCGLLFAEAWRRGGPAWFVPLSLTFGVQMVIHLNADTARWLHHATGKTQLYLNIAYLVQLGLIVIGPRSRQLVDRLVQFGVFGGLGRLRGLGGSPSSSIRKTGVKG